MGKRMAVKGTPMIEAQVQEKSLKSMNMFLLERRNTVIVIECYVWVSVPISDNLTN